MVQQTFLRRRTLHEDVVSFIRDMIISGELQLGTKVPMAMLCERFGVSRTPLREALKVLAAEGLLHLNPNRGATVASITSRDIEELFPILGALEALAADRACMKLSDHSLKRLETMHAKMVAHHRNGEWIGYSKLNRKIHEAIFEIAENSALSALYQQLLVRIHAVRFVAQKTPETWQEAVDDHERMMVALRAREGAKLGAILREHLEQHKSDVVTVAEGVRPAIAAKHPTAALAS